MIGLKSSFNCPIWCVRYKFHNPHTLPCPPSCRIWTVCPTLLVPFPLSSAWPFHLLSCLFFLSISLPSACLFPSFLFFFLSNHACSLFVSFPPDYSSCPTFLLSGCLFPSCLFFLSSLLSVSPSVCLFPSCLFFLSSSLLSVCLFPSCLFFLYNQPAFCLSLPILPILPAQPVLCKSFCLSLPLLPILPVQPACPLFVSSTCVHILLSLPTVYVERQ
jgi:hypothetical protein